MDAQTADFAGCDLFDHIDDFLNFPSDDVIDNFSTDDLTDMVDPAAAHFPPLPDSLNGDDDFFSVEGVPAMTSGHGSAVPALSHEEPGKLGSFDELDIGADMDWVSGFLDDSGSYSLDFTTIPTTIKDNDNGGRSNKDDSLFRTSSPVSVLESNSLGGGGSSSPSSIATTSTSSSSSSSSGFGGSSNIICGNPFAPISSPPDTMVIPGRARTKRTRPASFPSRAHVAAPALPPCSDPELPVPSDPESFGECKPPAMLMVKKKKKKKSLPVDATDGEEAAVPPVRKCMHCEITKTPQWRAGPMGPKTLCNACGVRYKSGRLFPEYRPAASPTFLPSIHSNSHKKVVEMRIKASQSAAASGVLLPENPATKGCDLLQFIRRRE